MSAVALVALLAGSCAVKSDLDALTARVETVESRVDDLEAIVNNLNKTVVPGLQTLVTALDKKLTVTSVVAAEDGKSYTINFSDGTTAVISSIKGDPGVSPDAPVIGTKAEGGVLYWTVNGEFLKDAQGNKIPVTGPQGPAGNDGNDGSDGEDGHTPVLGVKADTDGILYWTVDGEFLKDAQGNKVPATGSQGEPGSDGKTVGTTEIGGVLYWTVDGEVLKDGDGNPIPVRGQDGTNGTTPTVSIELVNGVWVWVINGEVVKDENGDPIPVTGAKGEDGSDGTNGITPQFKIMDGAWYVSYDNGATFERVGLVADTGTTVFVDADSDPDNVILTINTHEVLIPKEKAFTLTVTVGDNNGVALNETVGFPYTVVGVSAGDEVDVEIIGIIGGWDAEVVPADNVSGVINVTNNADGKAKITVYAANHKGKTDIRTLVFEGGVLEAVIATQDIPATGGQLPLTITANQAYEIIIPVEAQSWISVIDTRAHVDELAVVVEPNTTGSYRSATVSVVNSNTGDVVKDIEIFQYPSPDVITSIASVVALADDTKASLYNITAIAANDAQAIVTDGEDKLLVNADGLYNGVFSLTGEKKTSAQGQPYMDVTAVAFDMSATPIEVDAFADYYYYGFGANGMFNFYTVNNGEVSKDGDLFVISTPITGTVDQNTGETVLQRFVIDGPDAALGLDALVGKVVSVKGWVPNVATDNSGKEDINLIPTEVKEITLQEETGWDATYLGPVASGQYPEVIQFTVANPDENDRFLINVYNADAVDAQIASVDELVASQVIPVVDDYLFYLSYYSVSYGYTPEELVDLLSYYDDGDYETFEEFPAGRYYVVLYGVDTEGAITGKYAVKEFTVQGEPLPDFVDASYDDFLGDWDVVNSNGIVNVWTIAEKVYGESYTITGTEGLTENPYNEGLELSLVANYADGKFTVAVQTVREPYIDSYDGDEYIDTYVGFAGQDLYDSIGDIIFTAGLDANDALNLVPGTIGGVKMQESGWVQISANSIYTLSDVFTPLPTVATRNVPPAVASYESFLGKWKWGTYNIVVSEHVNGESYYVTGIPGPAANIPVNGVYDAVNGTFQLMETPLDPAMTFSSSYGTVTEVSLSARFSAGGKTYYSYPANSTEPLPIFTISENSDGTGHTLTPGAWRTYTFSDFLFRGTLGEDAGQYAGYSLTYTAIALPFDVMKQPDADVAYSKWLGTWTVTDVNDNTYDVTISEDVVGQSYLVNGFNGWSYDFINFRAKLGDSGELILLGGTNEAVRAGTGITIGSDVEYDAFLLPFVSYDESFYRISGNDMVLATFTLNSDGVTTAFTPGRTYVNFGTGAQYYDIVYVRLVLINPNDNTDVATLNGEAITYYPFSLAKAVNPVSRPLSVPAVSGMRKVNADEHIQKATSQRCKVVKKAAKAQIKPAPAKPAANVPARRSAQKIQSIPAANKLAK